MRMPSELQTPDKYVYYLRPEMEDGNGARSMWNKASTAANRDVMRNTAEGN